MGMLQGVWKQHLRPRAVVGYGVKIVLPSPPNYVTRSPGKTRSYNTTAPQSSQEKRSGRGSAWSSDDVLSVTDTKLRRQFSFANTYIEIVIYRTD